MKDEEKIIEEVKKTISSILFKYLKGSIPETDLINAAKEIIKIVKGSN
jgi:hypothetical protein